MRALKRLPIRSATDVPKLVPSTCHEQELRLDIVEDRAHKGANDEAHTVKE